MKDRVSLGFVAWGSKKLFLGVLTKIIIFFLKKDSNYFNMIHRNKSLRKLFLMGACIHWNGKNNHFRFSLFSLFKSKSESGKVIFSLFKSESESEKSEKITFQKR